MYKLGLGELNYTMSTQDNRQGKFAQVRHTKFSLVNKL